MLHSSRSSAILKRLVYLNPPAVVVNITELFLREVLHIISRVLVRGLAVPALALKSMLTNIQFARVILAILCPVTYVVPTWRDRRHILNLLLKLPHFDCIVF